ncbi:hypothetical protein ES703_25233 [subsurface metagenome]
MFLWANDDISIAFEAWFSTTGGIEPDAAELMIWIDYQGSIGPGGSYIKTVSIGGFSWNVYHASPWGSWDHYIAYRITTPTDYVSLDLKDFIDDSVLQGWISTSWYLDNMEAGFEIWVDGEGLTSKSFSGLVNEVFSVDFVDFADFATQWRRTGCNPGNGFCEGADIDESREVDWLDLKMWVDQWLKTGQSYLTGDLAPDAGDGIVNMADLRIWADNWLAGL